MNQDMSKRSGCGKDGCAVSGMGEQKHIKGIVCNVTNCVHHDCETHCTANEIAVGPSYASTSQDTACATFKQKKD